MALLQNLNRHLSEAQDEIASDDKLSGSALMKVLKVDPCELLTLPSECPSHHDAFWTPPDSLTVQRLAHIVNVQSEERLPLLSCFLKTVCTVELIIVVIVIHGNTLETLNIVYMRIMV